MNTVLIRRTLMLMGAIIAVMSGMISQADPLPAPSSAEGAVRGTPAPVLVAPAAGGEMRESNHFAWTNIGANSYIVNVKVVETGMIITKKVTGNSCNPSYCIWHPSHADLYDNVRDGQTLSWKVVAKFSGAPVIKSKSAARLATINEVDTPVLNLPADGIMLLPAHKLYWNGIQPANVWYTLFVVNTETGEKVSQKIEAYGNCNPMCAVSPHDLPGDLAPATQYKWYVKGEGMTGEKAKSETRTFVTP